MVGQGLRAAASRIFCTAGKSRPISTAMMAMTTNSSIIVNPCHFLKSRNLAIETPPGEKEGITTGRERTIPATCACTTSTGRHIPVLSQPDALGLLYPIHLHRSAGTTQGFAWAQYGFVTYPVGAAEC